MISVPYCIGVSLAQPLDLGGNAILEGKGGSLGAEVTRGFLQRHPLGPQPAKLRHVGSTAGSEKGLQPLAVISQRLRDAATA